MVWFESEMNISESDTIYTSGKFNDNILTICISVLICDMTFQGLINKKILGIKNMFYLKNFVVLDFIPKMY